MAIIRPAGYLEFTGPLDLGDITDVALYFAVGTDPLQDPLGNQRALFQIDQAVTDEPGVFRISLDAAFADIFGGIDDQINAAVAFVDDAGNESDLSEVISFPLDRVAPEAPASLRFVAP